MPRYSDVQRPHSDPPPLEKSIRPGRGRRQGYPNSHMDSHHWLRGACVDSFLLFQSAIGNSSAGLLARSGFFENFVVRFDHSYWGDRRPLPNETRRDVVPEGRARGPILPFSPGRADRAEAHAGSIPGSAKSQRAARPLILSPLPTGVRRPHTLAVTQPKNSKRGWRIDD